MPLELASLIPTENPTQVEIDFSPHPGQWEAWNATERFIAIIAGTQSGKTSYGPHWLLKEIKLRGAGDYMVVTPTYPLLETKALPEFLRLFEEWYHLGDYNGTTHSFTFSRSGCEKIFGKYDPNKKTVVRFGYAADPDSLESATAKAAWLDEAGQKKFKLESWQAIRRRLSIARGRVLITTTPYDLGWLKVQIFDRWKRRGSPEEKPGDSDYRVVRFDSTENPQFSKEEFETARQDLPPWKFDLFYRGIFTRPAGQIYDCFINEYDSQRHPHLGPIHAHKCKPFAVPPEWPRILSGDFGNVNTALGLWAENPASRPPGGRLFSGRCYLIKDYKSGNRTARQHLEHFLGWKYDDNRKRIPGIGENVRFAVGGSKSEDSWRKEYVDAGLPMQEPPVGDVEVGINNFYGMIKRGEALIFDTCDGTLSDIGSYSRELTPTGEPTEKIEDKASFHYADMCRYFAAYTRFVPEGSGTVRVDEMMAWRINQNK